MACGIDGVGAMTISVLDALAVWLVPWAIGIGIVVGLPVAGVVVAGMLRGRR